MMEYLKVCRYVERNFKQLVTLSICQCPPMNLKKDIRGTIHELYFNFLSQLIQTRHAHQPFLSFLFFSFLFLSCPVLSCPVKSQFDCVKSCPSVKYCQACASFMDCFHCPVKVVKGCFAINSLTQLCNGKKKIFMLLMSFLLQILTSWIA